MSAMGFWWNMGGRQLSNLLPNLSEYWKFDTSFIGEIIGDTPTLTTGVSFSTGKINDGSEVLSSPSSLTYPTNSEYTFSNGSSDLPFSISMWVYIDTLSAGGNWLISKRAISGTSDEYQITINSSRNVVITLYDKVNRLRGLTGTSISTTLSLNTWHHIVCTYNGSGLDTGLQIYVDNMIQTLVRTTAGPYTGMPMSSTVLRFFRATTNNTTIHFGKIDEVGIWKDRELNPSEVHQLYNSGFGIQYPF